MAGGKAEGIIPLENFPFLILSIKYTSMQKPLLKSRAKAEGFLPMDFLIVYIQYTSMQKHLLMAGKLNFFDCLYSVYFHAKMLFDGPR